ncbi:MAG: hypothetical protein L3J54_05515, partial [Draconibacterium sp.]|nr:hypothetical protein [Draconibacterium sp.]
SALLQHINKIYFWDIDINKLNENKSKRLIIERVINFGKLHEIQLLKEYYGTEVVIETLCNLNYIDPKTLNFISLFFNIPKTRFKCYIRKQLNNQPWNY